MKNEALEMDLMPEGSPLVEARRLQHRKRQRVYQEKVVLWRQTLESAEVVPQLSF